MADFDAKGVQKCCLKLQICVKNEIAMRSPQALDGAGIARMDSKYADPSCHDINANCRLLTDLDKSKHRLGA